MKEMSEVIDFVFAESKRAEAIGLLGKKINVKSYLGLKDFIPDEFVQVEEVFPECDLPSVLEAYKDYLNYDEIFPFAGTLGEAVICIGYGDLNKGLVYYFDFDFGCAQLDSDDLDVFLSKLL